MANKKNNELKQKSLFDIITVEKDKDKFEIPFFWDNDNKKNVKVNDKEKNIEIIYDYIKTIYEKAMRGDSESEKYKEILNIILNGTPETVDKDYIGIDVNELPAFLRPDKYKSQFEKQNEKKEQTNSFQGSEYWNELKDQITKEIKQSVTEEVLKDLYQGLYDKMYRDIKNNLKEELQQGNIDLKQAIKDYYTISQELKNENSATTELFNNKFDIRNLFAGVGHGTKVSTFIDYTNEDKVYDFENYKLVCYAKIILENKRISQRELSIVTKIPQSTLNGILNNTMPTSLENAFKISKVLGVKIEEIFDFRKTE